MNHQTDEEPSPQPHNKQLVCVCGQNNDGLPRMDIFCQVHDGKQLDELDMNWLDELCEPYIQSLKPFKDKSPTAYSMFKRAIATHIKTLVETECIKAQRQLIVMALACKDEGWGAEREYLEHRLAQLTNGGKE